MIQFADVSVETTVGMFSFYIVTYSILKTYKCLICVALGLVIMLLGASTKLFYIKPG